MRRDLPTTYPSEETPRPERERMGEGESEEDVEFRFIFENMLEGMFEAIKFWTVPRSGGL